jgi:hypothetical protein
MINLSAIEYMNKIVNKKFTNLPLFIQKVHSLGYRVTIL